MCCICQVIQAVDGFAVDGHTLRANFGTTKCPTSEGFASQALELPIRYCRKFLEGEKCERKVSAYHKPICRLYFNIASAWISQRPAGEDCNFLHKLADESNEKGNWKAGSLHLACWRMLCGTLVFWAPREAKMAEMGKVGRTQSVTASATNCRLECLDVQSDGRVLVVERQGKLPQSGLGGGLSSDSKSLHRVQ